MRFFLLVRSAPLDGMHQPPPRRAYSTPQRTPADVDGLSEAPSFLSVSGLKRPEQHLIFIFLIEK